MNTHIISKTEPLVYNGMTIGATTETLSLTDMWRASGGEESRKPSEWLRQETTKAFVGFLADSLGFSEVGKNHFGLVKVSRGGPSGGETFAHWQLAFAYAKYLSPAFHMWCNQVVRERMEGKSIAVASLPPEVLEMIRRDDGISRMLAHKVTGIESTVQVLTATVQTLATIVQPPGTGIYVSGKSSGEVWSDHGLPSGIKNGPRWLGNRLEEMGCTLDNGRCIRVGRSKYRMFDPDKAAACMKNGLLHKAKIYASERMGQRKLRLVGGESA